MKILICSIVLSVSSPNKAVTQRTLDVMTYLSLVSPDAYDGYIIYANSPLTQCIEAALLTCGSGNVCSVCVASDVCSFQCQDAEGGCEPAPPCGPQPNPTVNEYDSDMN